VSLRCNTCDTARKHTIDHTVCTDVGVPGPGPLAFPGKVWQNGWQNGCEHRMDMSPCECTCEPTADRNQELEADEIHHENGMKGSAS